MLPTNLRDEDRFLVCIKSAMKELVASDSGLLYAARTGCPCAWTGYRFLLAVLAQIRTWPPSRKVLEALSIRVITFVLPKPKHVNSFKC